MDERFERKKPERQCGFIGLLFIYTTGTKYVTNNRLDAQP